MTYKGSNWTRGELGNVPDPNPSIPCQMCEESYAYQDYWKERYVDVENGNPHQDTWVCDECHERARDWLERQKRKRSNQQLTAFADTGQQKPR